MNYYWQNKIFNFCARILEQNKSFLYFIVFQIFLVILASTIYYCQDNENYIIIGTVYESLILIVCGLLIGKNLYKLYILGLIILFCPVTIINIGWLSIDGTILYDNLFWPIFDTNHQEIKEFFTTVPIRVWIFETLYLAITIITFYKAWSHNKKTQHWWKTFIGIFLVLSLLITPSLHLNSLPLNFYSSFYRYYESIYLMNKYVNNRPTISNDTKCYIPSNKNIIIVFGESFNKNRSNLYGYYRHTNPLLYSIKDDLTIYKNVSSFNYITQHCMKQMLTFSDSTNQEAYYNNPSIIEILNYIGYTTYWYDNQGGKRTSDTFMPSSYRILAKQCSNFYVSEDVYYDEVLLPKIQKALNDTAANKVIFVHLFGSHFPYNYRYPASFQQFNTDPISKFNLSNKQITIYNQYDNSILYNDFIIYSIIELLKQFSTPSAMLYLSDHGEEVFDEQIYSGRSFKHITHNLYDIPFILWKNEQFDKINNLYIDKEKKYNTYSLIHTMLDLTGITCTQKDSSQSIFYHDKPKYLEKQSQRDVPTCVDE